MKKVVGFHQLMKIALFCTSLEAAENVRTLAMICIRLACATLLMGLLLTHLTA